MRREVESLLKKAHESLHAAELLKQEGYLDFAASRAYYGMFYAAQALLLDRGLSFSSHSAVIAAFGREFAKTGVLDSRFHRYLIDAQDLRNLGDYGVSSSVTADQADEILCWASEFLSAAKAVLQPPPSSG